MKSRLQFLVLIFLLLFPQTETFAKDDKALRKQRSEAQKERQQQKRDRSADLTDANRTLQAFARDQKSDYQQQLKDLDLDFQLREVELKAARDKKKAAADAEYQKLILGLFTSNPDSSKESMETLQARFKKYADENFKIKKEGAESVQQERVAVQKQKNALLDKRDQEILAEADSLGLTTKPQPILAEPIGGELTNSEKSWNDREKKEVERIYERNRRTLREYRNGKALRDWELTNMEEDFKLKWQEKEEIHKVQSEQTFYNSLMMTASTGDKVDQKDLMNRIAEMGKKIQIIRIDAGETKKKNHLLRAKKRRELRDK